MTSRRRRALAYLAAAVCLIGAGLGVWLQEQTNRHFAQQFEAAAGRLRLSREAAIDACERNDVQTVQANRKGLALYNLLNLTIGDLSQGNAARPSVVVYLRTLMRARDAQTWIAPTECVRAVDRMGAHYRLPPAIQFTQKLPPVSALTFPPRARQRTK